MVLDDINSRGGEVGPKGYTAVPALKLAAAFRERGLETERNRWKSGNLVKPRIRMTCGLAEQTCRSDGLQIWLSERLRGRDHRDAGARR